MYTGKPAFEVGYQHALKGLSSSPVGSVDQVEAYVRGYHQGSQEAGFCEKNKVVRYAAA